MLQKMITPRWMITTLLVVITVVIMIRLGFWQLDRLDERRAFNQRVIAQIEATPISLPEDLRGDVQSLYRMEYREAFVRGRYEPVQEILLRNQVREGQPGYHLLTPLRLADSEYVILVDRGFIDMTDGAVERRARFSVEGEVTIKGIFLRPRVPRYFGVPDPTLTPGDIRLDAWNAIRLDRIQAQVNGILLPVYLLAAPNPRLAGPPYAELEQPDLSEGPHMGYALQWFSFAGILSFGYPFFVRKHINPAKG